MTSERNGEILVIRWDEYEQTTVIYGYEDWPSFSVMRFFWGTDRKFWEDWDE